MPRKLYRDRQGYARHVDYAKNQIRALSRTDPILFGLSKGPWSLWWANQEEENGRSFSGQDVYELAPDPKSDAVAWAEDIAAQLKRLNGSPSLDALYDLARQAGFDKSPEAFGMYLGCQTAGHGISWCDDLDADAGRLIAVPSREFYV